MRNTGRPSIGGPTVTAGGLIFIAATDDSRFRAFETATGKEVWTYKMDVSAHADLKATRRQLAALFPEPDSNTATSDAPSPARKS